MLFFALHFQRLKSLCAPNAGASGFRPPFFFSALCVRRV